MSKYTNNDYSGYRRQTKCVGVKKIDNLGYGWAAHLAKYYTGGNPWYVPMLVKNSKVMFTNTDTKFHKVITPSGVELIGRISPNEFAKNIYTKYIIEPVSKNFALGYIPVSVYQKYKEIGYAP